MADLAHLFVPQAYRERHEIISSTVLWIFVWATTSDKARTLLTVGYLCLVFWTLCACIWSNARSNLALRARRSKFSTNLTAAVTGSWVSPSSDISDNLKMDLVCQGSIYRFRKLLVNDTNYLLYSKTFCVSKNCILGSYRLHLETAFLNCLCCFCLLQVYDLFLVDATRSKKLVRN